MSRAIVLSRMVLSAASLLAALFGPAAFADTADASHDGAYLAHAANCTACHTALGGAAFAGGLGMATPMGKIYTTNITPDPETGVAAYSYEEFDRAVRRGVAKDGHNLYPAMPYPSYAKISDADLKLLYDYFLKSVPAVKQANKPSEIPFPLNMRWPLAAWNMIFRPAVGYQNDPARDADWNRGAYLVEGLGHCGACHTPRGLAIQEKALDDHGSAFLVGAPLDNWSSPNLHSDDRAGLGRWTEQDMADFLKTGRNRFGSAFGSMIEVINSSTQYLDDGDLHAVAKYLKSLPTTGKGDQTPYVDNGAKASIPQDGTPPTPGALVYVQRCAACHAATGQGQAIYIAPLAGNPSVLDPDGTSLVNIVLNGSIPLVISGQPDSYKMPSFRVTLTDQQIADVVSFIKQNWNNNAPSVTVDAVAKIRKSSDFVHYTDQLLHMQ